MSIFDKDWFDRRSNYVVKDESKSIGWDSSFTTEFSRYLYDINICQSICYDNSKLIQEFREMMNSVNLKKDTECYINTKSEDSYTDGKKIFVSNNCIHDDSLTCFDKMDIMFGLLLHESAHCIYSDFSKLIDKQDKFYEIKHYIQNIYEDEAIEEKLCIRWPGNSNFLSSVKKYYFDDSIYEIIQNKPVNILDEILVLLLLVIRYPNKIKEYIEKSENKDQFEAIFNDIYKEINSSGYFKMSNSYDVTTKTSLLSEKTFEILKIYIKEEELDKQFSEISSDEKSSYNMIVESSEKLSSSIEEKSKDQFSKLSELKKDKEIYSEKDKEINRKITDYFSNPKNNSIYSAKASDKTKYNLMANEVIRYSMMIRKKILKNEKIDKLVTLNNMRSGMLNTNKLAEAYQGIEHSYDRRIMTKSNKDKKAKYALVIVIDESGSMELQKETSQKIAIMLYEAFKDEKDIEMFVYGHGDKVNNYIDKVNRNKYVLGNIESQNGQYEDRSYKQILENVHSQTKLNAVVISITDSYYITDDKKFADILNKYKNDYHDSFTLIKLAEDRIFEEDPRIVKVNNMLYGDDGWFTVKNNSKVFENIYNYLMPILKRNYEKSEKLHR